MHYNLSELALMTGYSTRSLRTFYKQGLLPGTITAGKYSFSEEDVERFMARPFIASGMKTKTRMQVCHFLEEEHTRRPATCLIHDEPGKERADQLNDILLEYINRERPEGFTYNYLFDEKKETARFIIIGPARVVAAVLEKIGK
ncbi:MAG: MerR family transcriptional regulator [Butyrivibrio sp.]|nr:MerR family transcriptional regulator [Acetatifactor muris]MCM1558048.1 MerR family transcriptional regulator [Butyrivibrio sp.]